MISPCCTMMTIIFTYTACRDPRAVRRGARSCACIERRWMHLRTAMGNPTILIENTLGGVTAATENERSGFPRGAERRAA